MLRKSTTCKEVVPAPSAGEEISTREWQFVFMEKESAAEILQKRDGFVAALGVAERSARLKTGEPVSIAKFLQRIALEALNWELKEQRKLEPILHSVRTKIAPLQLDFPNPVALIKTTGNEEGNAAYCRGNAIVLPQKKLERQSDELENLLIHELFHIYSQNHPHKKEQLYRVIGFSQCPELEWPVEMLDHKLTNPDAYLNNYSINLAVQERTVNALPVLYLNQSWDEDGEKGFFDYVEFGLLEIEINAVCSRPVYRHQKLQLFQPEASFYNQVGRNTEYIIHPEEILAENFVLLVNQTPNVASPFVIEGIQRVLSS